MNTKRTLLIAASGSLFVFGVVAILFGRDSGLVQSVGAAAVVYSVFLLKGARKTAASVASDPLTMSSSGPDVRIGRGLWLASIASVLLFAFSFHLLVRDAEQGYNDFFPVILFAIAALICIGTLGAFVVKLSKP
jgi:hypothetical protein